MTEILKIKTLKKTDRLIETIETTIEILEIKITEILETMTEILKIKTLKKIDRLIKIIETTGKIETLVQKKRFRLTS